MTKEEWMDAEKSKKPLMHPPNHPYPFLFNKILVISRPHPHPAAASQLNQGYVMVEKIGQPEVHGYVPLENLRPATPEELILNGIEL